VRFQVETISYSEPLELCSLRFAQTFLKEKRKKGKKRKEKALEKVVVGLGDKVFGKNTTRRVEIFIKTRRA
jgi:hypothetical protein